MSVPSTEPFTSATGSTEAKILFERLRFISGSVASSSFRNENSLLTAEMRELYQSWDANSDIVRAYLDATLTEDDRDLVEVTLLSTDSMDLKHRILAFTQHGLSVKEAYFILLLKKFQASKGKGKGKALF